MKVLLILALSTSVWCTPIHSGPPIKQEDPVTGKVRVVSYLVDEHGFKAQIKNDDGTVVEKDPSEFTIQNAKLVEVAPVRYSVKHSPVVHYYAGWPFPSRHSFGFKKPKPEAVTKPEAPVAETPVTFYSEFPFFNQGQSPFAQPQKEFFSGSPSSTQPEDKQFQFYSGNLPSPTETNDKVDDKPIDFSPTINFYSGGWPVSQAEKEDIEDSADEQDHKIIRKIPINFEEWGGEKKIEEKIDKVDDKEGSAAPHIFSGKFPIVQQLKTTEHHIIRKIPGFSPGSLHHEEKEATTHQIVQKIPTIDSGVKSVMHSAPIVAFTGSFPAIHQLKSDAKFNTHHIVHKIPNFIGHQGTDKLVQSAPVVAYTNGWPVVQQFQPGTTITQDASLSVIKPAPTNVGIPYTNGWPFAAKDTTGFHQFKHIQGSDALPVVTYTGNWPTIVQDKPGAFNWAVVPQKMVGSVPVAASSFNSGKETVDLKAVIAQAPFQSGSGQFSFQDGGSPFTSEWPKMGVQSIQKPESKVDFGPVSYTSAFQWSAAGSKPTNFNAPPNIPGYAAIPIWW